MMPSMDYNFLINCFLENAKPDETSPTKFMQRWAGEQFDIYSKHKSIKNQESVKKAQEAFENLKNAYNRGMNKEERTDFLNLFDVAKRNEIQDCLKREIKEKEDTRSSEEEEEVLIQD